VIALNAVNCSTGERGCASGGGRGQRTYPQRRGEGCFQRAPQAGRIAGVDPEDGPAERRSPPLRRSKPSRHPPWRKRKKNWGEDAAAVPLYQRAVELDPNFALAFGCLDVLSSNRGDSEHTRANFQKAFALLNRVSERDASTSRAITAPIPRVNG